MYLCGLKLLTQYEWMYHVQLFLYPNPAVFPRCMPSPVVYLHLGKAIDKSGESWCVCTNSVASPEELHAAVQPYWAWSHPQSVQRVQQCGKLAAIVQRESVGMGTHDKGSEGAGALCFIHTWLPCGGRIRLGFCMAVLSQKSF